MGCVGSKPEDTPAVALCRHRCHFLDEAIHQRYVLAEAHLAYFHSLKSVGDSLHRFFDLHSAAGHASSPVLKPKGDGSGPPAPAIGHRRSNSGDGHLQFNSDSDEDSADDDGESLHLHSENGGLSPVNHLRYGNFGYSDHHETLGGSYIPAAYPYPTADYPYPTAAFPPAGYPSGRYTVNYMRKQPTPPVLYQQRLVNSEPIHYGEASSSSSYYSSNYNNQNPSLNSYNSNYSNYGEFFGSSSQQPLYGGISSPLPVLQPESASSGSNSKAPPPPPPPASSGWDFLNPFESFESYYPPYTPSRDSKEVREEEGIPDLEDEDLYQQEVVKEVHGNQKFVDSGGGGDDELKKPAVVDEENGERAAAAADVHYRSVPNVVAKEEDPVEYEVHVVDKEVVEDQKKPLVYHNDSEVMKEIQTQFYRASELGGDLAKILEVGKVPHNRKHNAYQDYK